MAHMIPPAISPELIKKYEVPSSEIRVFEELKRLPDEFTCIWSVPWADSGHSLRSGEADFLIVHPKFPLTVLEVKGGKLACSQGHWSRMTSAGLQVADSPIDQAHRSREFFVRKFSRMPGFPEGKFIPNAAVVILTDTSRASLVGDSGYYSFVMTVEDFPHFGKRIAETMSIPTDKLNRYNQGIGQANADFIKKYFGVQPSFQIPMRSLIELDRHHLAKISREHYLTLKQLEKENHIIIEGRAGTGKTVLAIQKAVLEAQNERKTLLVCFNEFLAAALRTQIEQHCFSIKERVTCVSYHQLCELVCEKAGEFQKSNSRRTKEQLDELEFTTECVVLHDGTVTGIFDSVIVDEGQDFKESWWSVLSKLRNESNQGFFWVFRDEFQNVQQSSEFPLNSFFKFTLIRNFRNSRKVFEFINNSELGIFLDGIEPTGPDGAACRVVEILNEGDQFRQLEDEILRLTKKDGLSTSEIAVLSGRSLDNRENFLFGLKQIAGVKLSRTPANNANEIMVETIRKYKGLESKYVILVDIDEMSPNNPELENKLIYVGCTRAVSGLSVLAKQKTLLRLGWIKRPPTK